MGWHIDLLGWEDTLPGAGRPQALINDDVDNCDLFIGILHMRWGSPSGRFSSGFEEEFERAINRWRESSTPEIWLFFKRVDDARLGDPGPQLGKVLAFKEAQTASGELFYKEVVSTDEWGAKLFEYLSGYLAKLHSNRTALSGSSLREVSVQPSTSELPSTRESNPPQDDQSVDGATKQLLDLLETTRQVLQYPGKNPLSDLDREDVSRLYLAIATWMAWGITYELPTIHAVNLLYRNREAVELTAPEQFVLREAVLSNTQNNVPGWFWFRSEDGTTQELRVFSVALVGRTVEGRTNTFDLLTQMDLALPREIDVDLWVATALSSGPPAVRSSAISWIAASRNQSLLDALASTPDYDTESPEFAQMQLGAQIASNPVEAFRGLLAQPAPPEELVRSLGQQRFKVPQDLQERALGHPSSAIRSLALARMDAGGVVRKAQVVRLLADPTASVRYAAVRVALKRRWVIPLRDLQNAVSVTGNETVDVDEKRELELDILLQRQAEEIEPLIDWYTLTGPLAYEALAIDNFNRLAPFIRSDLEHGFVRIRDGAIHRLQTEFGAEAKVITDAWSADMEQMLRDQFTVGAVNGLALHGDDKDSVIVRPLLRSREWRVRLAAIRFLSRHGSSADVTSLLQMVDDYWIQVEAAGAALLLADDSIDVAQKLLVSEEPSVVAKALAALQHASEGPEVVKPLLHSEVPGIRRLACSFLASSLSRSALEQTLNDYVMRSTYFYNVVVWLDRLLYTKGAIRAFFKKKAREVSISP